MLHVFYLLSLKEWSDLFMLSTNYDQLTKTEFQSELLHMQHVFESVIDVLMVSVDAQAVT